MFKMNYLKSKRINDDGLKRIVDYSLIELFINKDVAVYTRKNMI